MLRLLSYLAPSVPEAVFLALARHVKDTLGVPVSVSFETRISGPMPGADDPFADGAADVGFVCAPSFVWMASRPAPSVELIPMAPVYDDPRTNGRPEYFSDLICGAGLDASSFADLVGRTFACNDPASLSGALSLGARLREAGGGSSGSANLVWSGSHLASIEQVRRGDVAAAAIDSTVLRRAVRTDAALASEIRVVESWGPFPVQPIVCRRALDADTKRALARALASACEPGASSREVLAAAGLVAFAPVTESFYESVRVFAGAVPTSSLVASSGP